ncbi:MAG: ribosome assembly factor SBDS [Candidatus Methanomethylicota archaeon]|uniref:Ribosome assembly factor SBDS n=1 Tax=Thermoproteota archaeon TaxID=2056631 RepID=A0A497EVR8_9CREN|nr:MAG: ribosome assembly factor SBDS [Candidatus Verstraetearchaeota archaeon]
MSKRRAVIARYLSKGERFEILVNPDLAWKLKSGKQVDLRELLISDIIYKDARKGLKASEESILKVFETDDPYKIAEIIVKKGELQLTAEQRRKLIESKKRQIINFISRNCVDPKTGLPHPPKRIELAMEQVGVSIDPFKDAEEQALDVIKALRRILPLKIANVLIRVKIPPTYAGKAYGIISRFGTIRVSKWLTDGSWLCEIEMPAGLQPAFIEKVNEISKGEAQIEIISEIRRK